MDKDELYEKEGEQAIKNASPEDVKAWADFYQKVCVQEDGSPDLEIATLKKSGDWKSLENSESFDHRTAELINELREDCLSAEAVDDGSKPVDWLKKRLSSKNEDFSTMRACIKVLAKTKEEVNESTFNGSQSEGVKV